MTNLASLARRWWRQATALATALAGAAALIVVTATPAAAQCGWWTSRWGPGGSTMAHAYVHIGCGWQFRAVWVGPDGIRVGNIATEASPRSTAFGDGPSFAGAAGYGLQARPGPGYAWTDYGV